MRARGRDHAEHDDAGPAQHDHWHGFDQGGHLRKQAERHHNETAGRRHPARSHAGNSYETDILRKRLPYGIMFSANVCAQWTILP